MTGLTSYPHQIPLNRMSDKELREIIEKRANRTVMRFSEDAKWTITVDWGGWRGNSGWVLAVLLVIMC